MALSYYNRNEVKNSTIEIRIKLHLPVDKNQTEIRTFKA